MHTLISCVGDSDPIRNHFDGPLLHIARVHRPNKIVLIHTERSYQKHEEIVTALQAIPNYTPEISVDSTIIKNNEVFLFDRMFEVLSSIIQKYYQTEEEVLLNLTSATPQIISAMFSINRISGLNVKAYQVVTPSRSSNEGISHDSQKDIYSLIESNKDNQVTFEDRTIQDQGEKFNKTLLKKSMAELIQQFDYDGTYELLIKNNIGSKKKRAKMTNRLESILNSVKYQKLLPDIENLPNPLDEKILLNGFLLIQLQAKRQLTSEVLIRSKNLAEFAVEYYLKTTYPGVVHWKNGLPKLNLTGNEGLFEFLKEEAKLSRNSFSEDRTLSLPIYVNILRYLNENSSLIRPLNAVNGINPLRNRVAHGFKEINSKEVKLNRIVNDCWHLMNEVVSVEQKWFDFFEKTNQELLDILNS